VHPGDDLPAKPGSRDVSRARSLHERGQSGAAIVF
jgi:hypothetical protein